MASTDPEDGAAPLEEPLIAPEATTEEQVQVTTELADLLGLTAAFFVSSVSWVAMKSTDTAILGHVGTRYLDATALSDLYTMSTGVFVQGRVDAIVIDRVSCNGLTEDLDGDGMIGFGDLVLLLSNFGPCDSCPADFNGNGSVDFEDLVRLLSAWS